VKILLNPESLPFVSAFTQRSARARAILNRLIKRSLRTQPPKSFPIVKTTVLAICCYMADRPNLARELVQSVEEAKLTRIDLVVTNNTEALSCEAISPYIKYNMPKTRKYQAVARIIEDQFKPSHEYVIVIDDDVSLPKDFFDYYFRIVKGLRLILSQPALEKGSFGAFPCNRKIDNAIAHLTSFVETGPVTCFERRLIDIVPFTEGSPMGWGLDFVWSRMCRDNRWIMGVVDCTPVEHRIRGVATRYSAEKEFHLMRQYLSKKKHVPICAAEVIGQIIFLKDYPSLS